MPSARSFVVLALVALALGGCDGDVRDMLPWRGFYVASVSMEPTLPKGTRLIGVKVRPQDLHRGDIVIVRNGEDDWVTRLVGLPGDRVAMVDGSIALNGKGIPQRRVGSRSIEGEFGRGEYAVFTERLPGEAGRHRVLDGGLTPQDNMSEVVLGEDEYFLLGDNRDNSADSRLAPPFGLGIVNGPQIRRRVELD